jgi:hypothetical protein
MRLSTYRALASDVYLALVYQDPIASAFELSSELLQLMENESYLRSEYSCLFHQVSQFTGRMLDHIENQFELDHLLSIERIRSALDNNQREFIIHTNTQQRIRSLWHGGTDVPRSETWTRQCLISIYHLLIFFPMYIGYYWLPHRFQWHFQWYFQKPTVRALLSITSDQLFSLFIVLSTIKKPPFISLSKQYPNIYNYYDRLLSKKRSLPDFQRTLVSIDRIFAILWILGYIYRNIQCMINRRQAIYRFNVFITILFLVFIILFVYANIQLHMNWQVLLNIDQWKKLEHIKHSK